MAEPDWISPDFPMGLPRGDDKDYYLGSPAVIEALIRNTMGAIYEQRNRLEDVENPPPPTFVEDEIGKFVSTLLNRGNRYVAISEVWNAESPRAGIVQHVAKAYGLEGQEPRETIAYPLYLLLQTMMQAEELDAAGEEWEHLVDGDIEKAVAAYIGAPDTSE
jgi:hypothetical protein